MTDLPAAPAHLLSIIRCNCKKTAIRCDVVAERMDSSARLCVVYAKEAPVKTQLTSPWKLSMTPAIEGDIYR